MIIFVISMIMIFSIINTNYAFADNKDTQVKTNEDTDDKKKDLVQDNYQNNQCH